MRELARRVGTTILTVVLAGIVGWGVLSDSPSDAERLAGLSERIACPVCDGSSIGASPSTYARDMKVVVGDLIASGRSDPEILGFFEDRYGPSIILEPPRSGGGLVLWAAPVVLLALGVWVAAGRRRPQEGRP
ncbi:MAG: cytochrome c-type biogenesis protein CcmH [Acidimicrobiia bacterium]|nr:cytochrome c-type biogenesis protein CcmH [Acidimicrobiia bacterium]